MVVYIVRAGHDYDGSDIVGVWSTLAAAEAQQATISVEKTSYGWRKWDWVDITPWLVDGCAAAPD